MVPEASTPRMRRRAESHAYVVVVVDEARAHTYNNGKRRV